jgi:type I restriction enzyme S subunit
MRNKMKITAKEEQARPALVPKLRFPDCQDAREWEVSTIGDSKPFVTSGSRGWAPFYSENGDLFVRITNLLRDSIYLDLTVSKYVQLPPGVNEGVRTQLKEHDVLISITADIGLIGYVDKCVSSPAYINQHIALVRFDEEQLCGKYVAYFLASEKTQKLFRASTDTGTKAGMSLIGIQKIEIMFPGLPEQQKIADFLSSVDELLAAQARKVDALKTYKKGLMQQLFPREGETQPRLRFPEFQNAGEWKPQCLSGLIDLISGIHLSPDDYSTVGEVPYFTGPSDFANDLSKVTKWTKRTANVSQAEDTLITVKGSGVGEIWYTTLPEVAMGRQLMAVRSKNGSSRFMFQFLLTKRSRFEDLGSGNLIPGLSRAVILELEACFPSPAEQQRIATCLTTLDALITAEIQKHEALKIHKKGLMQQLFPSSEEYEP